MLALAALLAGCGGDNSREPTSTAASTGQQSGPQVLTGATIGRDVQASDGRFSLRVPVEWVAYDDPIAELAFRTITEDPALLFNVVREDVADNMRVQVYAEEARTRIGMTYKNVISISLTPVMVGTIESYRWIYTATIGNRERLFYQLYIVDGGQGFVLTGSAPKGADIATIRSTFDSIAGSIIFARG